MSDSTASPARDATVQVDAVLARTGMQVTADERERLINMYPLIGEWTAALRLTETRYAEPALIYPARFER